jgi:hypothetical protein
METPPLIRRNGAGNQLGRVRAGVVLALDGGRGQADVGEQADRGPAVPGPSADDLPGVEADGPLWCGRWLRGRPEDRGWAFRPTVVILAAATQSCTWGTRPRLIGVFDMSLANRVVVE